MMSMLDNGRFLVGASDSDSDNGGNNNSDAVWSIGALLARAGSPAATLLSRAQRFDGYTQAVAEWACIHACPTPTAVTLESDTLTVFVSNAAHATTLRFRSGELLHFAQGRFEAGLLRVNVRIAPR